MTDRPTPDPVTGVTVSDDDGGIVRVDLEHPSLIEGVRHSAIVLERETAVDLRDALADHIDDGGDA